LDKLIYLSVFRRIGLFYLTKLFFRRKLLILCYHGFEVNDESKWWPGVFISRETLISRMDCLAEHGFHVLSLNSAIPLMYNNQLPDNSIVITVDDGFKSTLDIFEPIIKKYRFPVTVYVTTYYSQKQTPIFRLVVQYMLWKSTVDHLRANNPLWNKNATIDVDLSNPIDVKKITWEIINFGESACTEDERQAILFQLGKYLDVEYKTILDGKALTLLSKDEIRKLSESGIDIQLHTHRHHFPREHNIAIKEIVDNITYLSACVKTPLIHFCYPSGIWSKEHWPWLESLNISSATTCQIGFNSTQSSRYALKRYLDSEDISENEFLAEITGFLPAARFIRDSVKKILPIHRS